ncbi:MAG: triose-phosphate isomerase [Bacilli bacterium]|nr:triose-phosphate isomerase [Bacilli bacterium]
MRRKLLFANWKMHKNNEESVKFVKNILDVIKKNKNNKVLVGVAPTFLSLFDVCKIAGEKILVISQNVHFLDSGAYTGEISAEMLKSIGVNYSIIGHSERRNYYNENNLTSNLKIKKLLSMNMIPIYCCGEPLEIYKKQKTCDFIKKQICEGLNDIAKKDAEKIIIAYEPIWSIGSGNNMEAKEANKICIFIRKIIKEIFGEEVSKKIFIIYGGSVNSKNANEYLNFFDIDGFLIGSASLKLSEFKKIFFNMLK